MSATVAATREHDEELLAAIWRRAQGVKIGKYQLEVQRIYPKGLLRNYRDGEWARFDPTGNGGRPIIWVPRDSGPPELDMWEPDLKGAELPRETCVVAHELGHALSMARGTLPEAYLRALKLPYSTWPTLPQPEREAILSEEISAWETGREELMAVGFSDWSSYEKLAATALETYWSGLDLVERGDG